MKARRGKKFECPIVSAAQAAEDGDLMEFCHAAAVRMFQELDREETEAGLPDPYSPAAMGCCRVKGKSKSKRGGMEK
ncbi:MAG TPA: hypothetical protein VFR76_05985 [Verrucomicrobiae bacterium]|nr:hypothetical protein [Verrucomicrobiae bacterium]